ncbi:uncharacterized protein LOC117779503 [Drosophila innubila]|uniref:uncharacterized protein LOC117779503 n=1 Tax=Drosophila innubila TaxID=198719 RepID=UPI00148D6229|nr:uncharacterized protein LOC117779503 [Drosophila innubila]
MDLPKKLHSQLDNINIDNDCARETLHNDHELTHYPKLSDLLRLLIHNEKTKIKKSIYHVDELAQGDLSMLQMIYTACDTVRLHIKRQILYHMPTQRTEDMTSSWAPNPNFPSSFGRIFYCRMRASICKGGLQPLNYKQLNQTLTLLQQQPVEEIPAVLLLPPALLVSNFCTYTYWNEEKAKLFLSDRQRFSVRNCSQRMRNNQLYTILEDDIKSSSHHQIGYNYYIRRSTSKICSMPATSQAMQQEQQPTELRGMRNTTPTYINIVSSELPSTSAAAAAARASAGAATMPRLERPPGLGYPVYYLDMESNGRSLGRVHIQVRSDVAPRMAKNFRSLILHERGFGYKGCKVFKAWPKKSIITGDFQYHNGRGGYSAFDEHFFKPDESKLIAGRGMLGMKPNENQLVGSQFQVLLSKRCNLTTLFAFIVDGIEVLDIISRSGTSKGQPTTKFIIKDCGEYRLKKF